MAAVFKDQFVGLIVSSVLFFMNVSSMTTKSSKPYSASFKSGGLRLFKPGRSPVTILIPVKRLDSDEAAADEARNSTSDGRSARSPLVIRLLEEQEPQQPPPPRYTQAIFPAPEDAIHRDEQPAGDPAEQLLQAGPLDEDANYEFSYSVLDHEGNDYGHAERRRGGRAQGEYFARLPDGRLQTVRYWADDGGYHAEVSYDGRDDRSS